MKYRLCHCTENVQVASEPPQELKEALIRLRLQAGFSLVLG